MTRDSILSEEMKIQIVPDQRCCPKSSSTAHAEVVVEAMALQLRSFG